MLYERENPTGGETSPRSQRSTKITKNPLIFKGFLLFYGA